MARQADYSLRFGEFSNGGRLQMLPKDSGIEGALGRNGLSTGSGLFAAPYAFKIAMRVLAGEKVDHTTYYEGVPVTQKRSSFAKPAPPRNSPRAATPSRPAQSRPTTPSTSGLPIRRNSDFNSALLGEPD